MPLPLLHILDTMNRDGCICEYVVRSLHVHVAMDWLGSEADVLC